ncbi:MAG: hypothetical protein ABJA37_01055 [Ferruginibacter sp.]
MKQLLIVAPEAYGIIEAVLEGIKKYTDYEVDFLDLQTPCFKYKDLGQRVHNFIRKKLKLTNLKKLNHEAIINEAIKKLKPGYDAIIIIRPDIIEDVNLKLLRTKTNFFIAYYWDTAAFFPRKIIIKDIFDKVYSFDADDCKKYGFTFLSNFYFYDHIIAEPTCQVYNLSAFDYRYKLIENIAESLQRSNISFCFKVHTIRHFESKYISRISTVLNYTEMLKEIAGAEVLLDVNKDNQNGLTFRPFEAMGLGKKLITTNKNIRSYDFYDEQNILIIDPLNPEIPPGFFDKPYKELPMEIKEKYHIKNWIKTLLST